MSEDAAIEYHPDDDPLDRKFTYRNMAVLPPLPETPPKVRPRPPVACLLQCGASH